MGISVSRTAENLFHFNFFFPSLFLIIGTQYILVLHKQVEIKNLNSFSSVSRAIDFEILRQVRLHSQGQADQIVLETRLWEEGAQVIFHSFLTII